MTIFRTIFIGCVFYVSQCYAGTELELLPGQCAPFTQHIDVDSDNNHIEGLTFSATQKWDEKLRQFKNNPTIFLHNWSSKIILPPPPVNTADITYAELEQLLRLQKNRTKQQLLAIEKEIELEGMNIESYNYVALMNSPQLPLTRRLFRSVISDLSVVVFSLKEKFDRVRPHFLNKQLVPTIDVPKHPAYPSGHASQAYAFAYLLQQLKSDKHADFERGACQIALHREIAGVHYRSDSVAGSMLAKQFMHALMDNEQFIRLLDDVKKEWQKNGL